MSRFIRVIRRICVIRDPSSSSIRVPNSERGAVLVVVLGILALLTLIAVSFVYATRMSLRASEAYMRTVAAGDIAETGLANAIAVLKADKIKRTGDPLDATVAVSETFDSLRDSWRQEFSAPVVITYTVGAGSEANLVAGDIITNVISATPPSPPYPDRYLATAEVVSIDTINKRLYLNSISTALWQAGSPGDRIIEQGDSFDVTISSVSKPDEVDLDGDGTPDAVWRNYYDESGALLGRYAVLIQDESGKININSAGNIAEVAPSAGTVYSPTNNDYTHASNEGSSAFEINLADGLNTTANNARQLVLYRNGLPGGASWNVALPPTPPGATANRVVVGGQGDLAWTAGTPSTYNDDDDNFNRYFYENDGVDNDGDGTVDETGEGLNEPEEFRPLRPYRSDPLDYDRLDDNANLIVDETNESDDQPILTLEQLEDSQGVALTETAPDTFLTKKLTSNYDGSTDTNRERRHFISTNSFDRNLNKDGQLRVNPNFSTPDQNVATMHAAYPPGNVTETIDPDPFERPDLRNMQVAANIYDYRDRNNFRNEITDAAGDVFAGVEAIRINEVLVRAATNLYEAEDLNLLTPNWVANGVLTGYANGAISPRGAEDYVTNSGAIPSAADELTGAQSVTLPNPPFSASIRYPFKLRIRVRNDGITLTQAGDRGFRVWILDGLGTVWLVTDPNLGADVGTAGSSFWGPIANGVTCRWSTVAQPPAPNSNALRWYVEEATAMVNQSGTTSNLSLTGGTNYIYFEKPGLVGGGNQDTVDADWFYFTQEPDCEWIELVNLGNETVNVNNWTLVSEYTEDWSMVTANPPVTYTPPASRYYAETYQLTLPNVGILPVNNQTPNAPAPPQHIVFTVDRNDSTGSGSTVGNGISFNTTWSSLASSVNIYQFTSITNIYSPWIDFFGNEPLDNPFNNTTNVDARGTTGNPNDNVTTNIEVARISLYDSNGNLVDRVTYDAGNVTEAFASLQREHPTSPGDRLDQYQNFKMRAYTASSSVPTYNNVVADGNYDDWKFYNDPWLTNTSFDSSLSSSEFIGWTPNSRGSSGFMTPAEENNRSANYSERVATPESSIKNRLFSSVGELAKMPFYNEFLAVIGYDEGGNTDDLDLVPGNTITNSTKSPQQTATLVSIHTSSGGSNGPSGWMVVRGNYTNPVNTWNQNDTISSGAFSATVTRVKVADKFQAGQLGYYLEVGYTSTGDPSVNDVVTNTSKAPSQNATVTARDATADVIQLTMDPSTPVTEWRVGESLTFPGPVSATITSVRYKSADARGLADYFSAAFIDLEAAAATATITSGAPTLVNWPDSAVGPLVYTVAPSDNFTLKWDEDDGVRAGTYNLYSVINYGTTIESETPIYVGPITTVKDSATQQATISLTIQNAPAEYHFMRAILAPPPETFGRINANDASQRVLRGLPGVTNAIATNIIDARNIAAFQSIGDIYRASELDANFTPDVFANLSNLITTRSDIYKIIVLGQAATDSNKNGIIENNEITGEKKLEMVYQR